jgi:hypothetical protein
VSTELYFLCMIMYFTGLFMGLKNELYFLTPWLHRDGLFHYKGKLIEVQF